MKLTRPKTVEIEYRTELPGHLAYLANETPYLSFMCKPGGYLNPGLMEARDRIDTTRRVQAVAANRDKGDAAYIAALDAGKRETGAAILAAVYDNCVTAWSTNIIDEDTGSPIEPTRANFLDLAAVRVPEIASAFVGLVAFVDDLAGFIRDVDGEAEKN